MNQLQKLLLGICVLGTLQAEAAAPMVKTSAPGFYRVMLGEFEITALSDGTVALPVNTLLTKISKGKIDKELAKSYLSSPLETSVNAYLINTGEKLVLVDTGAAGLFGPTLGHFMENLKAAGYQPEQIDEIYITHLHGDHMGGLMVGEQLAFPNAVLRVDQRDIDFWLSQANMDAAPEAMKGFFKGAVVSIGPWVKAGKLKTFDGNTDLIPGVKSVSTYGHTPGHSIYMVESRGQKLALWGDLMHVAAVQFAMPEVTIRYDTDSKSAAKQRQQAYADAAKQGYLIGSAHLSFPGLGYLRKVGKGYSWLPVNYSPMYGK